MLRIEAKPLFLHRDFLYAISMLRIETKHRDFVLVSSLNILSSSCNELRARARSYELVQGATSSCKEVKDKN